MTRWSLNGCYVTKNIILIKKMLDVLNPRKVFKFGINKKKLDVQVLRRLAFVTNETKNDFR